MRIDPPAVLTLLLGLFVVASTSPAQAKPIDSTITHVTVYPEWAYVTRTAEVELEAGQSSLSLEKLPAWIDPESLRVQISSSQNVTILGVATETTYLARSSEDELNDAEAELTALRDHVEDLRNELAVLEAEAKYLNELVVYSLEKTPGDAQSRPVSVQELAEVQGYLKEQRLENTRAQTALNREVRELKPQVAAAEKKWNEIKGRVRLEQKRIVLNLEAEQAGRTKLEVSYLISGASWYPSYAARARTSAGEIEITSLAVVQQSTGEDWSEATFVLSTIQPYLSREKPELKPWYIGAPAFALNDALSNRTSGGMPGQQPQQAQQEWRGVNLRMGNHIAISRLDDLKQIQLRSNTKNKSAAAAYARVQENRENLFRVIRKIEERGTTVEFAIDGKYAVTADGKPTTMLIGQTTLDASRHYSASPAVSASTYVTAKMRHQADFPILPGNVRIYTDGSFTAKSELPFVAQNEKFELFLGLDERIKVTRELDYTRSSTTSWSNKQRLSAAYVINVKNYLDEQAIIEISDQVPVSQDKDIEVKLESVEPEAGRYEKGVLTWSVTLGAGQSRALRYAYRVEYPQSRRIEAVESLREQIRAQ